MIFMCSVFHFRPLTGSNAGTASVSTSVIPATSIPPNTITAKVVELKRPEPGCSTEHGIVLVEKI